MSRMKSDMYSYLLKLSLSRLVNFQLQAVMWVALPIMPDSYFMSEERLEFVEGNVSHVVWQLVGKVVEEQALEVSNQQGSRK